MPDKDKTDKAKPKPGAVANKQPSNPVIPQPDDGKRYWNSLLALRNTATDLLKDTTGYQKYEEMHCQTIKLKAEIAARDEIISKLRQQVHDKEIEKKGLFDQCLQRYNAWSQESTSHATDAMTLKCRETELKEALRELDDSKHRVNSLESKSLQQAKDIESLSRERDTATSLHIEVKAKLNRKCNELDEISSSIGMVDIKLKRDELKTRLTTLADNLHDLVLKRFNIKINDPRAKTNLHTEPIPRVESNSDAAKLMRCAEAEIAISRELTKSIFNDVCLVGNGEANTLVQRLDWLDKKEPRSAARLRCLLVKASKFSGEPHPAPGNAAGEVLKHLSVWLQHGPQEQESFKNELKALFTTALECWQDLRQTNAAYNPGQEWMFKEDHRAVYGSLAGGENDASSRAEDIQIEPVGQLFPQFWIEQDDDPLFHGFALFRHQSQFIQATTEQARPSPTLRRQNTTTQRRRTLDNTMSVLPEQLASRDPQLFSAVSSTTTGSEMSSGSQRAPSRPDRARASTAAAGSTARKPSVGSSTGRA